MRGGSDGHDYRAAGLGARRSCTWGTKRQPEELRPYQRLALTGAEPSVMDLPSISRVTKLPLEQLKELAKSTPIFAPGVEPLFATGAVTETWAVDEPLAPRLAALLQQPVTADLRDRIGLERKGRLLAQQIAVRVAAEAAAHARG